MIPNVGLRRMRAVIAADVSDGIAGTGTTLPAVSDVDLETSVTATEVNAVVTESGTSFQVEHTIVSSEANGNTLTEWAVRGNSDVTLFSRIVTNGVTKTSGKEVTKLTTFNVLRG